VTVYRKNNLLLINQQLFELAAPGTCRDGKDHDGPYSLCVRDLVLRLNFALGVSMDSVYVFEKVRSTPPPDSSSWWFYVSAKSNLLVKKEKRTKTGKILRSESLTTRATQ